MPIAYYTPLQQTKLVRIIRAFHSIKIITAAAALIFAGTTFAQGDETIIMSPASEQLNLKAGEQTSSKLTVINDGETEYGVKMSSAPFRVQGEEYEKFFDRPQYGEDSSRWVKFSINEFSLKAGERREVGYTVSVPTGAAPGGHYAVLFAETQPAETGTVVRKKRVGELLYMTVDGVLNKSGRVDSWQADFWQTSAPLTSQVRLGNDGNVHYTAKTEIAITDIFGRRKAHLLDESIILPKTLKQIYFDWKEAPGLGLFRVSGSVEYLDRTEVLPAKTVLMLNATSFVVFALILTLIISFSIYIARRQ